MSLESKEKLAALQDRALSLQKARSFFFDRNILEVDTPLLSKTAPIDEHIDILSVDLGSQQVGYLHSSPEYAMKRLLSLGIGDIFQIGHVFRQGEVGAFHNPEFTMVEWYRVNMPFPAFIEETISFFHLLLGPLPYSLLSYREAFYRFANIDYLKATTEDLLALANKKELHLSSPADWDKESLLHLLMGCLIEPHLGQGELTVLTDYPASQAALAQTENKNGELVAKRFEIYYLGIELANGYLELTDPLQQRARLLEANEKREQKGKASLPLDEFFLQALTQGIPPCCGVAVGFDRIMLLKRKASSLQEVLPFSWDEV